MHTPPVFQEAPPTMLPRLFLGGEVVVTAGPVMVILTTAPTTVAMVTPDAHIVPVATDNTHVPSMYASLFPLLLTISSDPDSEI